MRVLIVEDDPMVGEVLAGSLTHGDYIVDLAETLGDAEAYLSTTHYSCMLLDLHLPDGDGLNLLKNKNADHPPTIILTADGAVSDRVRGLDAGADDYLNKPFAQEELMARVRAVLRRPASTTGTVLVVGDLRFDTVSRTVQAVRDVLSLPRRELNILETLMRSSGRVVMRELLEEATYSYGEEPLSNATEANICRLRKRLREAGSNTEIRSIRGLGYMLAPKEKEPAA